MAKHREEKLIFCGAYSQLGGVFKYLLFSPLPGEMIQFEPSIFFQIGGSTTS